MYQAKVNQRGEAFFSKLNVGTYDFHIILQRGEENEKQLVKEEITVDGKKSSFDIFGKIDSENSPQQNQQDASDDSSQIDLETSKPQPISDSFSKHSCNCVAFRFDDIQNFWLNDVQIKVMETFYEKETPVTIGIIGNHFGKDEKLVNSVKNFVNANFDLEIANHGWEHEDFAKYNKNEQSELLKKSNDALTEILGVTPTTFIPPLNSFNEDTLYAMTENGLKYFSTELDESDAVYQVSGFSVYHFPEGAATGKLNKEISLFEGLSHEETLSDIHTSIENYGFAVVTLHPQEFSVIKDETYSNMVNQHQIDELKSLIAAIDENSFEVVLLSEIDKKSIVIANEIPSWVKNNAQWWGGGRQNLGSRFFKRN